MEFDYYEYKIPTCYLVALVNGDISGLNDEDIKTLDEFVETLPEYWTFEFGEEVYFSYDNDVDRYGNDVVDAKCYFPVKEN